jgi:hypothetical protein
MEGLEEVHAIRNTQRSPMLMKLRDDESLA